MSPKDPDDNWFFSTLKAKKPISLMIDYNGERKNTFVFVNALIGDVNQPLGVTGVGSSLQELSNEFQSYKYGAKSDLWLIDRRGNIYLSDDANHNGQNIRQYLPPNITRQALVKMDNKHTTITLEYKNSHGDLIDLISYPVKNTNWQLLFQIPRSETVSFLNTIKMNTLMATLITLIAITFFFNFVSRNIANPYQRALQLNQELENQVAARTKELYEKNQKLIDSIDYAKRIQESVLPTPESLNGLFKDHFLLWKPRDLVD